MLTLIIPTMNRSEFLIRLLRYYADTKFKYQIIIGDSSNESHLKKLKDEIKKIDSRLKITLKECPNLSHPRTVWEITSLVTTPYTALVCDDDFLIGRGLEKCVNFLETNKDYVSAHGSGAIFSLKESGSSGQVKGVREYMQPSIELPTGAERLSCLLHNYSVVLFSVHRTSVWKKMWHKAPEISDLGIAAELLAACISIISGKTKQLDCLTLVRQGHDARYGKRDIYDRIHDQGWSQSVRVFSESLAEELIIKDNISKDVAENIVKNSWWDYLNLTFRKFFLICSKKNIPTFKSRIGKKLRKYPNIKRMIARLLTVRDPFSLNALLNKKSTYYADFLPIYRAITGDNVNK